MALCTQVALGFAPSYAGGIHDHGPHRAAVGHHQSPHRNDYSTGFLLPRQRSFKSLNQIYQFDHSPLGKRIPVLLVPGRAEEFQHNAWWKEIWHVANQDLAFNRYFKLYVFLYNSKEELDVQAEGLVKELKGRFGTLPASQPLMMVTYSLGGVIVREMAKDTSLLNKVDTMIAIAVPFHGSPMFDPEWFSEYLNPPTRSPLRRFWDRSLYRGYMFSKSNLTRGLNWDNFDSSKPQFQSGNNHPNQPSLAGDQACSTVQPYQEYPNADLIRQKTIVYANYLENAVTHPESQKKKSTIAKSISLPRRAVESVVPFYGFTVHAVLSYMGLQLANLPTYTPDDPQGKNTQLYRYNDGAIPVSSMLFLKPSPDPYDDDLWGLIGMSTVRNVRVFKGHDHLHIGEYARLKGNLVTPDLVHPEDGQRSPHRWIIHDLFKRMRELRVKAG
ncbi:esterase/lipase family protein [Vampirovibrio sp.]|uniref:esterase/lipase family protein n=1 Tax=Vampirovibrio sp. TaxID=2717857 RepID=UPI0035944A13